MRAFLILAALLLSAAAAGAEPCNWGGNRPAIDTMPRNITPGGTVIRCRQDDVVVRHPDGTSTAMKAWTFGVAKGERPVR